MHCNCSLCFAYPPALVDGRADVAIRQPHSAGSPLGDLVLQQPQGLDGAAYVVQPRRPFPDDARHGLVVTGDNDLLAGGNAIRQLPEAGSWRRMP